MTAAPWTGVVIESKSCLLDGLICPLFINEALEASYDVAREVIELDDLEEGNIFAAAGKQDK